MTYQTTFPNAAAYIDLNVGATAVAPGTGERDYTFNPTITSSKDGVPRNLTATAKKPDINATYATVTASPEALTDAPKDAGRYTVTVTNDSNSALTDFTIATSRKRGSASFTRLSCDLTAFGGEVVTAEGPVGARRSGGRLPGGCDRDRRGQYSGRECDRRRSDL